MAGTLPEKIALIGLDLSMNQEMSGWFLLIITVYIFIKFVVKLGLEVLKEKLPKIIGYKTTGDTIGLTQQEIYESYEINSHEDGLTGTMSGEETEIAAKNQKITSTYVNAYESIHNSWIYLSDYLLPIILCFFAVYSLYSFLVTGQPVKFT